MCTLHDGEGCCDSGRTGNSSEVDLRTSHLDRELHAAATYIISTEHYKKD